MTLNALRQRDVIARVYVSPREVEQCVAKRTASPDADNEYNLAHILVAIPSSADEKLIAERTARAQGVYERAIKNEDFAQLAITLFRFAARRSKAVRSAGARPASCRRSSRKGSRR